MRCHLLRRLLGVKKLGSTGGGVITEIKKGEVLLINVGSTGVGGKVTQVSLGANHDQVLFELVNPVCSEIGEKIAISRRIDESFR